MKPAGKRFIVNGALFVVSIAASFGILEAALRVWYADSFIPVSIGQRLLHVWQAHPTRGWALMPNVRTLASNSGRSVPYETNSRGLRDREFNYSKPPGVFRILILGDSFMEAQQVPLEDCLAKRLEAGLANRRVEVLNFGVSGYGTIQEYLYLMEEGLRYEPDLVFLAFFCMNDVDNNSQTLSKLVFGRDSIQSFGRPYTKTEDVIGPDNAIYPDVGAVTAYLEDRRKEMEAEDDSNWFQRTQIYRSARLALARFDTQPGDAGYHMLQGEPNILLGTMLTEYTDGEGRRGLPARRYAHFWKEAWGITKAHVGAMDRVLRDRKIRFAVFTVPERLQVEKTFLDEVRKEWPELSIDTEKPQRDLKEFCRTAGIPFIDLVPAFAAHDVEREGPLYVVDRHWNEKGHALAAGVLQDWLTQSGAIP